MDCSLATWPSITQFDDFSWTKLGDLNPLENLDPIFDQDRQLNADSQGRRTNIESADFLCLSPCAPLVAGRWESINSLDLASFLDSTFPPVDDSSTSNALDGVNLCHAESLVQQGCDVDVYMRDPVSELPEVSTVTLGPNEVRQSATLRTGGSSSISNSGEDVKLADYDGSSASISGARMDEPASTGRCCEPDLSEMVSNGGVSDMISGQSLNSFEFAPDTLAGCVNPCNPSKCVLDVQDMVFSGQHNYTGFGSTLPSAQPCLRSMAIPTLNGDKVVHHRFPVQPVGPITLDQELEFTDAIKVRSELKRSRAEASRARRRAASQRRAKKYPLQKLIRMSSSPSTTRDKIDQNLGSSAELMMQPKLPMVSPTHFPAGDQTLPRSMNKPQMPSFVPAVLHSLDEGNHLSPRSCAMQPMGMEQNMVTVPLLPPSHTTTTTATACMKPLDATLLEQLQSVLSMMSVEMRLCIRDALCRLARSARQRQSDIDVASGSDGSSCQSEAMETHTNSIDRWIVNILFCKQPIMEASNASNLSQQWNSCGSFGNLQERPMHAVTGS